MDVKQAIFLSARYILLLLLGFPGLFLIYLLATPLTIYFSLFVLKLLLGSQVYLYGTSRIVLDGGFIDIIPACVAGAAYYFLLILNLSTPMKAKTRIKSLIFIIGLFYVLNVIRITLFSTLAFSGLSESFFDIAHKATWYFGSTFLVVLIWFANVRLFGIKNVPIYTDFKNIYAAAFGRKRNQ